MSSKGDRSIYSKGDLVPKFMYGIKYCFGKPDTYYKQFKSFNTLGAMKGFITRIKKQGYSILNTYKYTKEEMNLKW